MKDCSSCKVKPEAGSRYEKTPCRKCAAWEPESGKRKMVQKPAWWWKQISKGETLDTCSRL